MCINLSRDISHKITIMRVDKIITGWCEQFVWCFHVKHSSKGRSSSALARSLWWAAATFGLHAFSFLCSCYVFWTSKLCERKRRVETIHDRFNYVLISGFRKKVYFLLISETDLGKPNLILLHCRAVINGNSNLYELCLELNSLQQS